MGHQTGKGSSSAQNMAAADQVVTAMTDAEVADRRKICVFHAERWKKALRRSYLTKPEDEIRLNLAVSLEEECEKEMSQLITRKVAQMEEQAEEKSKEIINLAIEELGKISALDKSNVLDSTLIRMPKAYPAYFGSYDQFPAIRDFVDRFENLFLLGRNGMHRYNNQDHSMLTAMAAVDKIAAGITDKSDIWTINTEQEYHETKESDALR